MSRTLKDRPYWVKANDKSLSRTPSHNHEDAGKPVSRWLPVKDENGNNVMETYTYYGFLGYRAYNMFERRYKTYATWEELVAERPENYVGFEKRFYAHYGDVEKTRVKHESVIIGYKPTECTIDDYIPRPNHYFDNDLISLCDHRVEGWAGGYYYCDHFPTNEERKDYHRKARSNENDALRKLTKAANAGYDYDAEDLYEDIFNARKRRHRGWWC
jgi:hypothetical protein